MTVVEGAYMYETHVGRGSQLALRAEDNKQSSQIRLHSYRDGSWQRNDIK